MAPQSINPLMQLPVGDNKVSPPDRGQELTKEPHQVFKQETGRAAAAEAHG